MGYLREKFIRDVLDKVVLKCNVWGILQWEELEFWKGWPDLTTAGRGLIKN